MSEIHIATRDGQKAVYHETDISPAIAEGRIPDGALYWKEGMTDWRPVSELKMRLQGPSSAPPPPPSQYKYFKDPTTLTTILTYSLYAQAVVALISLFSDWAQLPEVHQNPAIGTATTRKPIVLIRSSRLMLKRFADLQSRGWLSQLPPRIRPMEPFRGPLGFLPPSKFSP